ncbi:MAG: hypothetical protein ACXVYV_06365, partial [Gaiellales bacterium]
MTRRRLIVVVAVAVLLAGAAGVLLLVRSSRSTPVSRQQAVNRFRHGGSRGGGRPTPGVYTYAVSGWECAGI